MSKDSEVQIMISDINKMYDELKGDEESNYLNYITILFNL